MVEAKKKEYLKIKLKNEIFVSCELCLNMNLLGKEVNYLGVKGWL